MEGDIKFRIVNDTLTNLVPSGSALYLDSDQLDRDIRYIKENGISRVGLSSSYGFRQTNLSFMNQLSEIKGIDIGVGLKDISDLYQLKGLKRLSISSEVNYEVDLSMFPNLEILNITYRNKFLKNIESLEKLKLLILHSFSDVDLEKFRTLKKLQYLTLNRPKIKSLKGIEKHKFLKNLDLNYCRSLVSIDNLPCSLKKLSIYSARALTDYKFPEGLDLLEYLSLLKTGSIQSLRALSKTKNLKTIDISINVLDGDVSPLLGIKDVRFNYFPHFSHTLEEVIKSAE